MPIERIHKTEKKEDKNEALRSLTYLHLMVLLAPMSTTTTGATTRTHGYEIKKENAEHPPSDFAPHQHKYAPPKFPSDQPIVIERELDRKAGPRPTGYKK